MEDYRLLVRELLGYKLHKAYEENDIKIECYEPPENPAAWFVLTHLSRENIEWQRLSTASEARREFDNQIAKHCIRKWMICKD